MAYSEGKLYCENNGINLSCIADGRALGFMSTTHIYSLFGNAISNAIEALNKISDTEKRVISISVVNKDGQFKICLTNYFNGQVDILNNTPQTTKDDVNRHGYGIKSMKHIVDNYKGSMDFKTEKDIFYLVIRFNRAK